MKGSALKMALLGGADNVNVQRWSEGLSQAGADVILISFTSGQSDQYSVYQLPIPTLPGKLHYFVAVPYVRRLLKTICPDVVAAYYVTGYGTLGSLVGFHPLVQVTAGSDVLLAPHNPLLGRYVRFNLVCADLVTAWGPHIAETVYQLGVEKDRIITLPRGIPFEHFSRFSCSKPSAGEKLSIISTRSLKAHYKIDLLLRAARLMVDQGVAFSLTIAGDGPERSGLERFAAELGLGQFVRFVGFIPNDQLPIELARHHFYISLIPSDGVSASLLEAMSCGLCPMVPDNTANRLWITPGENGLLLADLSPETIVQRIRDAIHDVPLRERAWQNNPQIVGQRANRSHNSKIFVERFQQLVNDRRE